MLAENSWLQKSFVKPMNKFANFRIIRSISAGFQSGVGLVIIGAMLTVVSILLGWIPGVADSDFLVQFNALKDLLFGIMGVIFAFSIAAEAAKINKTDEKAAGFLGIAVFFIFLNPTLTTDEYAVTTFSTLFSKLGFSAVFVSIVSGIWAAEIQAFFKKRNWILNSAGLPDIAKVWFDYMISGTVGVLLAWVLTNQLNVDLHTVLTTLLSPLVGIFGSFWGWLLVMFLAPTLFFVGVHPAAVLSLAGPVFYIALANNVELLAAGLEPTVANGFIVVTIALLFFANIGGAGATFGLNLLMLFSKNEAMKKLGRLALLPSILNINEPLIFGIPIIYNPLMAIPFILGNVLNGVLVYFVFAWGLVKIPATYALAQFIPAPINAYILTNDFMGPVVIIAIIAIDMAMWAPFLKTHERNLEAKAAKS